MIVDQHALEIAAQIFRASLHEMLMRREPSSKGITVTDAELADAIGWSGACVGEEEYAEIVAQATADALEVYNIVARKQAWRRGEGPRPKPGEGPR